MVSKTIPKTYSLLSIGQRGAGKTVFLAGSYTELHRDRQSNQLWIDCRDNQTQKNMEALLNYISRSGNYPPPTVKITNFNFSLRKAQPDEQTLCHFRWWDLPGESCTFDDAQFRQLVFDSNGCCVFIDADALVHNSSYREELQEIRQQLIPIVTLVHLNRLSYAFAFLLTKCDLLETDTETDRLQEYLHPLTNELDTLEIDYRTFYLRVPIVTVAGRGMLQAQGTAEPLLWLVDELETYQHQTNAVKSPQEAMVPGSLQSLVKSKAVSPPPEVPVPRTPLNQSSQAPKINKIGLSLLILILAGLVGIGLSWWYVSSEPSEPRPTLEQ